MRRILDRLARGAMVGTLFVAYSTAGCDVTIDGVNLERLLGVFEDFTSGGPPGFGPDGGMPDRPWDRGGDHPRKHEGSVENHPWSDDHDGVDQDMVS